MGGPIAHQIDPPRFWKRVTRIAGMPGDGNAGGTQGAKHMDVFLLLLAIFVLITSLAIVE